MNNKKYNLTTAEELLNSEIEESKWIANNLIIKNGISILGGRPGDLKTFSAQNLGYCICTGKKFLGEVDVEQGTVIYLDEENPKIHIKERIERIKKGLNDDSKLDRYFIAINNDLKLENEEDFNYIFKLVKQYRPKLIIFDSIVRFTRGNENSSEDISKVYDKLKILTKIYPDVSILILHHTRKGLNNMSMDELRGSGDYAAFPDIVLGIQRQKDKFILKHLKNRHGDKMKPLVYEFETDGKSFARFNHIKDYNPGIKKSELCAKKIKKIMEEEKLVHFMSSDMKEKIGSDFKNNAFSDALTLLQKEKYIENIGKGIYIKI